jgi:hypothetical protein
LVTPIRNTSLAFGHFWMTNSREPLYGALWLVPAAMLLLALAPFPYAYYRLLRLVVCICCGIVAYRVYDEEGFSFWAISIGLLAILFNPLIPIHFSREIWAALDAASGGVLFAHFAFSRGPVEKRDG